MKHLKKILLITCALLAFNSYSFAKGSFEAILNVPVGMSFGGGDGNDIFSKIGFDSGVNVKLGYMFVFNKWAFSILGDIGYSYDSYKIYSSSSVLGDTVSTKDSMYIHGFQIGVLPKFNFGAFSLGIGIGVKVPFALTHDYEKTYRTSSGTETTVTHNENFYGNNIGKLLKSDVIPYFKVTFEYSIYFNEKIAFNIGAYLGYDFNIEKENIIYDSYFYDWYKSKIDTFDIGLQFGLRFTPQL
ncbi:hypothetical protein BFL38_12825 [Brachyspira hampsonii]|uniref:Outer membrane protein beta-barrel domain-containing protein n=1 Tax=Brachyspira hampsonii TaxID=1287055 RepID=A0A1E5NGA0_9SPIR|nr:hypothetical protein [Brachyspira hampsonii]OEJ15188.1 hypothetical protein BFL38_12825 [Brachyspira hampsonii]